jgi:hypothetical protein
MALVPPDVFFAKFGKPKSGIDDEPEEILDDPDIKNERPKLKLGMGRKWNEDVHDVKNRENEQLYPEMIAC